MEKRRYRVSFVMESDGIHDARFFGEPTPEWVAAMMAGPGSIWRIHDCQVKEEGKGSDAVDS